MTMLLSRRTHYAFDHCSDPTEHAHALGLPRHRANRPIDAPTLCDLCRTTQTTGRHGKHRAYPGESA